MLLCSWIMHRADCYHAFCDGVTLCSVETIRFDIDRRFRFWWIVDTTDLKRLFFLFQLGIWFIAIRGRIVGALDGQRGRLHKVIPGWMRFDRGKCDGR